MSSNLRLRLSDEEEGGRAVVTLEIKVPTVRTATVLTGEGAAVQAKW